MIEVCAKEGVSPKQVFFFPFSFGVVFIIIGTVEKNLNKSVEDLKNSLRTL